MYYFNERTITMKLEQSDISLLFSNTSIPDAFFTEYLSQAPSDAVKVYLYLFFLAKYEKDVRIMWKFNQHYFRS